MTGEAGIFSVPDSTTFVRIFNRLPGKQKPQIAKRRFVYCWQWDSDNSKWVDYGLQATDDDGYLFDLKTFIDDFLTEEFVRNQMLFTYGHNDKTGYYEIQDRDIKAVREKLLFSLTNMGHPYITVVDANFENRGELYLKHRFDGVELRIDYAKETLKSIYTIWTRPVHIQTIVEEKPTLLSYDGTDHKERTLTEKSAA